MRAVWNANSSPADGIPEDAQLNINFAELTFPEDPAAEDARWQTRIRENVANRAQWVMAIDPDISTIEEAEQKIADNARINEASRTAQAQRDQEALGAALGVPPAGVGEANVA